MLSFVAGAAWALEVLDAPRWGERVTIDAGAARWDVSQGLFFPVVDGERPVGFVLVGPGRASYAFAARAEDWWARSRGATPEEAFDLALSLGPRPEDAAIARFPVADLKRGDVSYIGTDGQQTVVVTGFDYSNAFARAKEALSTRSAALARSGVDPDVLLDLEAADPVGRWLGEVRGDVRHTPLLEPAVRTFDDRWLSFSVDPRGMVDPERAEIVFVHGLGDEDAVRWVTLTGGGPIDPLPAFARGVQNLSLTPDPVGRAAEVQGDAVLQVAGEGGVLPLAIQRHVPRQLVGGVPLAEAFSLVAVTDADGAPLERVADWYGPWAPADAAAGIYARRGGEVHVRWTDAWPISNPLNLQEWVLHQVQDCTAPPCPDIDLQGTPELVELGRRITGREVWPTTGRWAPPYEAELRVGTSRKQWVARPGAATEQLPDEGGGTWWRVRGTSHAELAFGELPFDTYAATRGFPEMRVDRAAGEEGTPSFLRAVMNFFGDHLPPFPHASLQIVRDVELPIVGLAWPAEPDASQRNLPATVSGSPGTLVVHGRRFVPIRIKSKAAPVALPTVGVMPVRHPVERGFAQSLARQWFDGMELHPRDAWIRDAFAVYLRDRFVEEAYGERVAADWRAWQDERLRADPTLPRTGPRPLGLGLQSWSGEVGGRLLHDLLEPRIGERALLAGLAAYLQGGDPSTGALAAAMTKASGTPLQDFFDAWFVAGLRPDLDGVVTRGDGGLRVELTCDVAYTLDVPVRLVAGRVERTEWIRLQDGRGSYEDPLAGPVRRVIVDPSDALGQRSALADAGG